MGLAMVGGWGPLPRVGLVLLLVVLLVGGLMWLGQRAMIYFPDSSAVPAAGERVPGARDTTLTTSDGLELGAWLVPPRGTDRETAVLVANGNAGNREDRIPLATALAEEGFTVLLFDYRGYGGNPGSPSEEGLATDARAAARGLSDLGFAPDRTLYFGESIGAGVAVRLARDTPPAGMVLRSPFTDLAAVGRHHYPFLPVRLLLRDRYPVAEVVRGSDVPTSVVYGSSDSVVPTGQSRAVARTAGTLVEEVEVPGADHNDPAINDGPQVVDTVVRLAEHVRAG